MSLEIANVIECFIGQKCIINELSSDRKFATMFTKQIKRLLPIVLLIIGLYVVRILWWQYLTELRKPFGFAWIFVLGIPFGIMVLFVGSVFLIVVGLSLYRTDTVYQSMFALIGAFLVLHLPLPEPTPLPEVIHFQTYRDDYEATIDLIRNSGLEKSSTDYCKHPPHELKHVSEGGCISNSQYNDGLKVTMTPIDKFYYSIIYIENDNNITQCGHRYHIAKKLDEHWYLCWREA